MSRPRPYVGKTFYGDYRVFRSDVDPTEETHGYEARGEDCYLIAYGPLDSPKQAREYADLLNAFARAFEGRPSNFTHIARKP